MGVGAQVNRSETVHAAAPQFVSSQAKFAKKIKIYWPIVTVANSALSFETMAIATPRSFAP